MASTTVEVYKIVTYAFRNKTSSSLAQKSLKVGKWLFAGTQFWHQAFIFQVIYIGLSELDSKGWRRVDSIITIRYYSRRLESMKFQYAFVLSGANLVASYDLHVAIDWT